MQKTILKAGEIDKFYTAIASVTKDSDGKYSAILTLCDAKKKMRYAVTDIKISGKNKKIVLEQAEKIAKIFPPKQDKWLLDLTEVKNG